MVPKIPDLPKKSFAQILIALTKGIPISKGEGNYTAGGNSVVPKIPDLPKKILRVISHGNDGGDSPLLWRGARGEANGVNIFSVNIRNNNTKNSNTTT